MPIIQLLPLSIGEKDRTAMVVEHTSNCCFVNKKVHNGININKHQLAKRGLLPVVIIAGMAPLSTSRDGNRMVLSVPILAKDGTSTGTSIKETS